MIGLIALPLLAALSLWRRVYPLAAALGALFAIDAVLLYVPLPSAVYAALYALWPGVVVAPALPIVARARAWPPILVWAVCSAGVGSVYDALGLAAGAALAWTRWAAVGVVAWCIVARPRRGALAWQELAALVLPTGILTQALGVWLLATPWEGWRVAHGVSTVLYVALGCVLLASPKHRVTQPS